jgi:formyltetrahydrofolate synthetase
MGLISKNQATTKAIFSHLCDQMEKLNAKVISVEEAKAQANMAKQANNILKYELDKAVAVAKFGEDIKINDIESLKDSNE